MSLMTKRRPWEKNRVGAFSALGWVKYSPTHSSTLEFNATTNSQGKAKALAELEGPFLFE